MQLEYPVLQLFDQLAALLQALSDDQYTASPQVLSGATVGQHVRHIIECYQELDKGYHHGHLSYDHRKRDLRLETDRLTAICQMSAISASLERPDKSILLTAALAEGTTTRVFSTYYRELLHNLEHTVHHMAIIRIAVEAFTHLRLPAQFGIAYSTIKFKTIKQEQ